MFNKRMNKKTEECNMKILIKLNECTKKNIDKNRINPLLTSHCEYILNAYDEDEMNVLTKENINTVVNILRENIKNILLPDNNKKLVSNFILNKDYIQDHLKIILKEKIDSLRENILEIFDAEWFVHNCHDKNIKKITDDMVFCGIKSYILNCYDEYLLYCHIDCIFTEQLNVLMSYREHIFNAVVVYNELDT